MRRGPLCTFAAAAAQANISPDIRLIVIGATEEEVAAAGARPTPLLGTTRKCV